MSLTEGFILTRSSHDRRGKVHIEYWLNTQSGPARVVVNNERPVFFIRQQDHAHAAVIAAGPNTGLELSHLPLKSFDGAAVVAVYANSSHQAYRAQDAFKQVGIETLEADIRPHDRYLMERFIYGSAAFTGQDSVKYGHSKTPDTINSHALTNNQHQAYTDVINAKLKPSDYRPTLRLLSLDIECAMDGELFSVGLASGDCITGNKSAVDNHNTVDEKNTTSTSNTLSSGVEPNSGAKRLCEVIMIGAPEPATTHITWVRDEAALLTVLCQRINTLDPDLIVGWNVINFDMRLLIERATALNTSLKIGRDGSVATWRARRNEPNKGYTTIAGRLVVDGIDALKSATWSFASFSLNNVAQELLGRGKKIEGDVDDRIAEIVHNFKHNKPALAAYNLEDCELVLDIFEHTNIIDYLVLRSRMTGLELDRMGGSVAAFTNLYLPKLHRGGYVAPNLPAEGGLASPGGYVMNSKPGLYRNVLVLDFKSLYPSIIRTFKVDPMGLLEGMANPENSIPGFKGAWFDREQHFLPDIITQLWQQRDQAKRDQDSVRSQAIKIIMNSFYGVLGSGGCRFYDTRLASSITMRGHEIMQTTAKWIEAKGHEVIYGDTDSTFVALSDALSPEQCRVIGVNLAADINHAWQQTLKTEFDLECQLEIEFETHFSRFLMPTIRGSEAGSKKRYAGLIIDTQTGDERIVFKGLENVRTDWTPLARQFQAELFDLVFHQQDPTQLVKQTVSDTLNGQRDIDLVYKKQLRRSLTHYVKNVPPQVRAARLADEQNLAAGKSLKYQHKGWIAYVITTHGPEPVEYLHSNIAYQHYIDKQLKPIADGILPFVGLDFDGIISNQGELF